MEMSDGDTDEFTQSSSSFAKQRSRSETDHLKVIYLYYFISLALIRLANI